MSAVERARLAYDQWWPTATKAFDLLLNEDHRAYGITRIYDRGMVETLLDEPEGWLDDGEIPLDLSAYSAHTRVAFAQISPAFEEGLRGWLEPIRGLSHAWGLRLYLGFRFWREDGRIMTHFQIVVEPGDITHDHTQLAPLLTALEQEIAQAYA